MRIPIVTIIGKPNVGKSMFFNRVAGSRLAITTEEAGTTRDRIFFRVEDREMDFFIVDTGGLEFELNKNSDLENNIQKQTRIAIDESDLIIFMVNGKEELTADDLKAAELLRKNSGNKDVILTVNKCDNPVPYSELAGFFKLGIGQPYQISALHDHGIDALLEEIKKLLKKRHFITKDDERYSEIMKSEEGDLKIALVGRTNVGKSSMINAMLNQEKLIVSDIPGTTRDSIDTIIRHDGKDYVFTDTAGMRRKGKIGTGIEHFSVLRTIASIEKSDVALLVLDSSQHISHQDQQIASVILEAQKGLIVLANKWDMKRKHDGEEETDEEKRKASFIRHLQYKFPFLSWAPMIFTSTVTKKNLSLIFEQVEIVVEERKKRISTAKLNSFVSNTVEKHKPTGTKNINPKIFYATQIDINPPRFVFFVNKKKYFHFSYIRYLENRLREEFGFIGTPVGISFQEKEERYHGKPKPRVSKSVKMKRKRG